MPRHSTPLARKRHESGYALLMVFLLAASIAIGLYAVAPRVAFESQRDKEQLLVDRGEQYKRSIQLFYRKFHRYPVKIEDLENTQSIRFLRQRYLDPMTGKSQWRLIHVGPGGQFTDSLTQKNTNTKKQDPSSVNTFIAEFKSVADPTDAADQLSPALRRRPSDQAGAPGLDPSGSAIPIPVDPNNTVPDPDLNAGGFPVGSATPGTFPGVPGDGSAVANPSGYVPGGEMPLAMQQQLQQQMEQNGQAPPTVVIGAGGSIGNPNQTIQTNTPVAMTQPGPAAIQHLLTSPRPGGPPPGIFNPGGRAMNDYGFVDANGNNIPSASNPQPVNAFPTGNNLNSPNSVTPQNNGTLGGTAGGTSAFNSATPGATQQSSFAAGSFAGVASTLERKGIKKYADHSKYNEWEFIYDFAKDIAKASGGAVNTAGANTNSPGANNPGGLGNINTGLGNTGLNGTGTGTGTTAPTTPVQPINPYTGLPPSTGPGGTGMGPPPPPNP